MPSNKTKTFRNPKLKRLGCFLLLPKLKKQFLTLRKAVLQKGVLSIPRVVWLLEEMYNVQGDMCKGDTRRAQWHAFVKRDRYFCGGALFLLPLPHFTNRETESRQAKWLVHVTWTLASYSCLARGVPVHSCRSFWGMLWWVGGDRRRQILFHWVFNIPLSSPYTLNRGWRPSRR